MRRQFTLSRVILGSFALFAIAAYSVPRATEGWYRGRILKALEDGLGRKVEIGQVRFRLVPTPGFAVSDVRIGEDPAVGAEPAAYVDTLVVRPSVLALLSGKLAVGSVRLEGANINLTRADKGAGGVRWNFSSVAAGSGTTAFPAIYMPGGRVNFKFGDTKSIFYLWDTDIDVSPSSGGNLKISVDGQPARTDRRARGFGSFRANGRWNSADRSVEFDLKLERSELSDVLSLFEGRESTLLGKIWGDAHMAGPMSKIGITGRMNISDLHGWNQLPPGGSAWPLTIGGTLDAPGQTIDLVASGAGKSSPIGARFHVTDYLGRPRWTAAINLDEVPVAPLTGIARNFGIGLPADLAVDGTAEGTIGYSTEDGNADTPGMEGQVRVANATMTAQGAPPLRIAQADVKFAGSTISLLPTPIVNDAGESAAIDGSYDVSSGGFEVSLTSDGMAIASLRRQISVAGAPIVGAATAGSWSGRLHYSNPAAASLAPDGAPGWTGDIHLQDTDIAFEAFAQPIHVIEAEASIDATGADVKKLRMTVGPIAAQGDYRYEIGDPHPHRFHIVLSPADAGDLEKMLTPALRRAGFLTYAFNFGRVPEPDWLRNMHAEGSVQAASLALGGTAISNLRTNVIWDGADVKLSGLTGRVYGAGFAGGAVVHLGVRQPRYEVTGKLTGFAWQGGNLTATGEVNSSGIGTDLLAGLHAVGTFSGRKLEIATLNPWDSVDGHFEFSFAGATPRLRLSDLTIQSGETKWTGGAETQDGGQTVVKVVDGPRRMEVAGALLRGEALKAVP